jgi:hypothetical protein
MAGMHAMLMSMQPIIERQLEVIQSQRFLGNLSMIICFSVAFVSLALSLKHFQKVKFTAIVFKKRWLALMIATWLLCMAGFNIFPGMILMTMQQEVKEKTPEASLQLLFGSDTLNQENLKK